MIRDDLHPPLYPLFVGAWARLFGIGEVALRVPSALFGAALVPVSALLADRLWPDPRGRWAGIVAAALVAVSPLVVLHSQEARNTTLGALEAALATWALARAVQAAPRGWLLYGGCALALVYTHYVGFLVLAAHALYLTVAVRPARWRGFLLAGVAVGVLYLPWVPSMVRQLSQYRTYFPGTFSLPTVLAELAASYISGVVPPAAIRPQLLPLGVALAAVLLAALLADRGAWRAPLLPLLVTVLPVAALLAIWSQVPKINPRYLVAVAPTAYILVGWAFATIAWSAAPGRPRPALAVLGLTATAGALAMSVWGLQGTYAAEKDDYRALVAEIERRAAPGEAILALMELDEPVRYYYRGPLAVTRVLDRGDFAATSAALNDALAGRTGVWLVTFGEDFADPAAFVRHSLAERAQAQLFEHWYGTSHLTGYRIDPARAFTAEPIPSHPAQVRFENGVEFVGWDLAGGVLTAGQASILDWHWRPLVLGPSDFKLVITVEDGEGRELARIDRTPATLIWSPPRWPVGEVVHGQERLTVPAATPPGSYRVRLRAYDPSTLRELAVVGPDGRALGTIADVGSLDVGKPSAPPADDAIGVPRLATPIDFGGAGGATLRLLGFQVTPGDPREGDTVDLTLAWRAIRAPGADFDAVVRMRDPAGTLVESSFPPVATYPTQRWAAGDVFVGHQRLPLPPDVRGGRLAIEIGVHNRAGEPLPAVGPAAPFAKLLELPVRGRPARFDVPALGRYADAQLGSDVRLLGYDLDVSDSRPGGSLKIALWWQALSRVGQRWKVFVHLVDNGDGFVGQDDAEPRSGALPTTAWKPGEVVEDRHVVPIRPNAPPGRYRLEVGLYDGVSGVRAPVTGANAGTPPDYVELVPIEVRR